MTIEDDRLDLSALDPLDDPQRWEALLRETLRRVDEILAHRSRGPLELIAAWRRPLLIAAAATLAVLIPVERALDPREEQLERVDRLVALSSGWEPSEPPPTGSQFLSALGQEGP
jgi:hypothetical protein